MATFKFPLQVVLDQYEKLERDQKIALARIEAERQSQEGELIGYQNSIREQKEDLRRWLGGAGTVDLSMARLQAGASLSTQFKAQQSAIRLAGTHRRLEEQRERLREASRRRKAVELLKERQFEAWKREMKRREAAELDELAVMRAGWQDKEII